MQRPSGINLTAGLMGLAIVLHLVASFTRRIPIAIAAWPGVPTHLLPSSMIGGAVILAAVVSAIIVFFYGMGHEWARRVVVVESVMLIFKVIDIIFTWNRSHLADGLIIGRAMLAVYLLWYSNTAQVRAWFSVPSTVEATA